MIGQEWDSCLMEVYAMVKSPLVENFAHGWKNDMVANVLTIFWNGVLWRSFFLGNLKALDKKLGLQRTLTWIKYYPSMCCFQYFKVIFEGLGLVFKHFYMLQCIVSCSILMTCLILTKGWLYFPKSSSNLPSKCKEHNWEKKTFPSLSNHRILFYTINP
jgi:hypothetical protein